ncbi:hypothetical protein M23134_03111 [Microscilla marina ATCC 23134]|uniref:Uncharacterized protein n=1 Tax=Microscilla marina ATCC 23134 TaxID=313606 RepID=A1ZG58_MICM2|nr:hypothetical protein M23134_03111 [Microscilla marina ATCC 23134]
MVFFQAGNTLKFKYFFLLKRSITIHLRVYLMVLLILAFIVKIVNYREGQKRKS